MAELLKINFPNIIRVSRSVVPIRVVQDPNSLTGFIDGEGCFFINIPKYKYKTNKERTDKV